MLDMTNAEIVEILIELDEDCENDITLYQHEALKQAAEIVRKVERGELVDIVHKGWERMINPYGELEGFICPCGHSSQSATKFCSTCGAIMSGGERKDGAEK